MHNWQTRTELLIGKQGIETLATRHVLVAGLGGVGAYAAEQLCRAGVGKLTIADGDTIHASNRNRQLPALLSTQGLPKAEVMESRLRDINPAVEINAIGHYLKDQSLTDVLQFPYDYVVDAIDTLAPKVYLLYQARKLGLPVVSSMGAGGKFDPLQVQAVDIDQTNHCRLAYYIRKKLHKLGVWNGITAVYSPEPVSKSAVREEHGEMNKKSTVGTISYMPAVFGCICASVVIRALLDLPASADQT
ncbi:MAG: tRNA threonylcarbamoyladenosine dehydratase [Bacteroidales bacterium]|nr:tRNA threonylcarbamoyladenosine dehydratase [Bacteroidales bacterium]